MVTLGVTAYCKHTHGWMDRWTDAYTHVANSNFSARQWQQKAKKEDTKNLAAEDKTACQQFNVQMK